MSFAKGAVAESALSMKDVDSRYMLQTRTNTGSWDQVTGVSQGIINNNFENLFRLYPKMAFMDSMGEDGRISAELESPKIVIPGTGTATNSDEVLYLMRFKSGSLYNRFGQYIIEDLSGWVIAYSVKLHQFSDDPRKAPKLTSKLEQVRQENITQSLREKVKMEEKALPQRYSIERLYTKLSSAKFSDPDKEYSRAVVLDDNGDPAPIAWADWASENYEAYSRLRTFIEKWAIDQDNAGRNAMGYNIQLKPEAEEVINKTTYEPTDLVFQTYPYRQIDSCKTGTTGDDLLGSRNAFLYCEMTQDRQRPDDNGLVWSGNFTTLPSTPTAGDAIEGTFLLSREVFLECFLLPQLRTLNQATDFCHGLPSGEQKGSKISCTTPYNISYDPKNPSVDLPCYDWKNLNPDNLIRSANGYRYMKVNEEPAGGGYVEMKNTSKQSNLRARTRDEMTVDVTWEKGSPKLTVTGHVTSNEYLYWDQGGDIKQGEWDMNNLWARWCDKYTATWTMSMTFKTVEGPNGNGILDVDFDTGANHGCGIDVTLDADHLNMEEEGQEKIMKQKLIDRFTDVIPKLTDSIRNKIQGKGRFVFPGNGVFSFKEPAFTKWGDLVAKINYLPLKADMMVLIPGPVPPLTVPPPPTTITTPIMSAPEGQHTLTWTTTPNPCRAEADKKGKIVFRGINNQKQAVAFKEIRIVFSAKKAAGNLFFADGFYLKGKEPQAPTQSKPPIGSGLPKPSDHPNTSDSASEPVSATKAKTEEPPVAAQSAAESAPVAETTAEAISAAASTEDNAGDNQDYVVLDTPTDVAASASKNVSTLPGNGLNKEQGPLPFPEAPASSVSQGQQPSFGERFLSKAKELISPTTPSPEPEYGLVTFAQNTVHNSATVVLALQNAPTSKAKIFKWQITIDDVSDTLRMEPGESVEVALEGRFNMPGQYSVLIDEEYVEPTNLHWNADFKVAIQ
ncbi:hypothetical protein SCAR479_09991 [Seiridium cardinale]|uniref:Uncharacterized protein n=1 Tax=Seiridium cardinale TaxID=138064 RepID=A0ABR2XHM2_9PEZI